MPGSRPHRWDQIAIAGVILVLLALTGHKFWSWSSSPTAESLLAGVKVPERMAQHTKEFDKREIIQVILPEKKTRYRVYFSVMDYTMTVTFEVVYKLIHSLILKGMLTITLRPFVPPCCSECGRQASHFL